MKKSHFHLLIINDFSTTHEQENKLNDEKKSYVSMIFNVVHMAFIRTKLSYLYPSHGEK